jgi:phospholysine phosphohistidine inorganic pyrophosphate phosphatase
LDAEAYYFLSGLLYKSFGTPLPVLYRKLMMEYPECGGPMRAILFDMDGVLYNSEEPIAGAADAVAWVQAKGIPHLFVTNTTSRGRDALVEKLERFGIRTDRNKILSPCIAAADWLRRNANGRTALFIAPGARIEFQGVDFLPEQDEAGAQYVVIGDLGDAWDFHTLNRAFRLLHSNPLATLVALGMTKFWHAHDGLRLDVAPFVAALEHATGRSARVFGKPAAQFYLAAVEQTGSPAHETVMIGDGIETDVEAAQRAGLKGVLVRTGKFRESDLEGDIAPDAVLDSIADLPGWWKD